MNRRNKIKWNNIFVVIFMTICMVIFVLYFISFSKKEEWPKVSEARIFMVGDALIHDSIYVDAKESNNSFNFKPMIELIKPYVSKYDLAYYNQETILGGSDFEYSGYPTFNSPQEVGDAFIDAGFNLVSLANNHTMDKGVAGVMNSVKYWKSKDSVVTSGQWSSEKERNETPIYNINGISYAFFSYTTSTNGLVPPDGMEYLSNVYSYEKALSDIEYVKDRADIIIVAMHWGEEYYLGVTEEQEKIANELAQLGVNLIIGTHPHVVEPVEYINDNKTFVIYSLGNFISSQIGIDRLSGLVMELTIKKVSYSDGNCDIILESPKADLVYTKYDKNSNYKVFPYSKLNDNILPSYLEYYEKYKTIVSSRYNELEWGILGE